MKKKKTALMMAAVMTVSLLAACGQKTSAPAAESTAQPDAAQTTEASKEASQEESQAPAESSQFFHRKNPPYPFPNYFYSSANNYNNFINELQPQILQ